MGNPSIFTLLLIAVSSANSTKLWEVLQITKYNNIKTANETVENGFTITSLKSNDSLNTNIILYTKGDLIFNGTLLNLMNNLNHIKFHPINKKQSNESNSKYVMMSDICNLIDDIKNMSLKTAIIIANLSKPCMGYDININIVKKEEMGVIILGMENDMKQIYGLNHGRVVNEVMKSSGLIYDEHFVLPNDAYKRGDKNYKHHAYVTAERLRDRLYKLIINSDYDKAFDQVTALYRHISGKNIISDVVRQLFEEKDERVMIIAYKLAHEHYGLILEQCFSQALYLIFYKKDVKLIYNDKIGGLRLKNEVDSWKDRKLYADCGNSTSAEKIWKFIPTMTNNTVSFEIRNSLYNMQLKLDVNSFNAKDERWAWGDGGGIANDGIPERFYWRLKPVSFSNGNPHFCISNVYYKQNLVGASCSSGKSKVKGVKDKCRFGLSWYVLP